MLCLFVRFGNSQVSSSPANRIFKAMHSQREIEISHIYIVETLTGAEKDLAYSVYWQNSNISIISISNILLGAFELEPIIFSIRLVNIGVGSDWL